MAAFKNAAAALKSNKNTSATEKKKKKTKPEGKKLRIVSKIKANLLAQIQGLEKETIDLDALDGDNSKKEVDSADDSQSVSPSVQKSVSDGSTYSNVVESVEELDVSGGAPFEDPNPDIENHPDDHHSIESEIHDHLEEQRILINLAAFGTSFRGIKGEKRR